MNMCRDPFSLDSVFLYNKELCLGCERALT
jgi:hypothetical protein